MGDAADDAEDRALLEMVEWNDSYRHALKQTDEYVVEVCEYMIKEYDTPDIVESVCKFYRDRGFITIPQKRVLVRYWADNDY